MPNPGGLYRGCGVCRGRKIKCDQTFPSCKRCQKAQIPCSGVPGEAEVMFRDKTFDVIQKYAGSTVHSSTLSLQKEPDNFGAPISEWREFIWSPPISNSTPDYSNADDGASGLFDFPGLDVSIDYSHPNYQDTVTENKRTWDTDGSNRLHDLHKNAESHSRYGILSPSTQLQDYSLSQESETAVEPSVLPRSVVLTNAEIMVQYFFQQTVISDMWLSMLPGLYSRSNEQDAIRHAIQATSMFLLGNQTNDSAAFAAARKSYSQCLNLLSRAIFREEERLKDAILCTILLLHFLNDIVGERSLKSGSHLKACKDLLLQRGFEDCTSNVRKIANSLVIQSQPYVLENYKDYSGLCEDYLWSFASAKPALEVMKYCVAVGKLRTTVNSLPDVLVGDSLNIENLWLNVLQETEDLNRQLDIWESNLTGRWARQTTTHNLTSTLEIPMDFYDDFQVGKVWNQYRCACIALQEVMIEVTEHLGSTGLLSRSESSQRCQQAIQSITTMLSDICSSIPFHLQQINSKGELLRESTRKIIGGEHLLWPLDVILHSPWSSDSQRLQAQKALDIGSSLGLRQAKAIRDEQRWSSRSV